METTGGSYVVSIPVYEGPMDLLLHLVSKNRIEIHDIPIHEITDQYLDYLNQAQVFNLELGSSFFTMAATLLLIKSRTLLPKRRQEEESETEDGHERAEPFGGIAGGIPFCQRRSGDYGGIGKHAGRKSR